MNPNDFFIETTPYTARFDLDGLRAKAAACDAAGQDSSFYVGVIERMKGFEAGLSSSPRASSSAPIPKGPSPV